MSQQTGYYEILGIARDASVEEIRAAFRKLTLEHHPDRFSGVERARAEERFQAITEAFNVLSRPDSKKKYDEELSQGVQTKAMDRTEIARRLAAKGAQAMREGDVARATELLRSAIDHDDENARANYFLGLTLGRVAGRERDALRHLERATQLEPHNAAMKAETAVVALAAGLRARSRRIAQEALSLDPTNGKAQAVLAEIDGGGGGRSRERPGQKG